MKSQKEEEHIDIKQQAMYMQNKEKKQNTDILLLPKSHKNKLFNNNLSKISLKFLKGNVVGNFGLKKAY